MTAKPLNSVLEGGALSRGDFRDTFLAPLNDFVGQLLGGAAESELTIASGSVTPTGTAHLVDTESDAASDDLTHLQVTNLPAGSIVQLRAVDAGRTPTLKHGSEGSGQMLLAGSADVVLSDINRRIWLQRVGTDWVELWRSDTATDLPRSVTVSGVISPSQLTGNQNNYSPTGLANAATMRLTSDASRNITGLAGGAKGRVMIVENVGANPIVLVNQSASSTAANRFLLGADVSIPADRGVVLRYDATSSRWRLVARTDVLSYGLHCIPIPGSAWAKTVTAGAGDLETTETTAGRTDRRGIPFGSSADEHAQIHFPMPPSYDGGPVYFRVVWSTDATDTDGVAWGLQCRSFGDGESLDQAFGTAVLVTDDAQSGAEKTLITDLSAAVTPAGTPAGAELMSFDLYRDVSDANDDMTEDAYFVAILIFFNVAAGNDA